MVVLEDIQHMDGQLLAQLATMFDESFPHINLAVNETSGSTKNVSTERAIFLLVSDLGEQSLNASMSREDARMAVRDATSKRWPSAKMPKFVHEIVAFLPLSEAEMGEVAELELRKYRAELEKQDIFYTVEGHPWSGQLSWESVVPKYIGTEVFGHSFLRDIQGAPVSSIPIYSSSRMPFAAWCAMGSLTCHEPPGHGTGRGVQQQVQTIVDDAWDERDAAGDLGPFDNIHLSVCPAVLVRIHWCELNGSVGLYQVGPDGVQVTLAAACVATDWLHAADLRREKLIPHRVTKQACRRSRALTKCLSTTATSDTPPWRPRGTKNRTKSCED